MKNKHLLIVIAVLGLTNAVACLLLIASERTNSAGLSKIAGELQETRKDIQEKTESRFSATDSKLNEFEKSHARLEQKHEALNQAHAGLQSEYGKTLEETKGALKRQKIFLDSLRKKEWLTKSGDDPPWEPQVRMIQDQIKVLDEKLNKLADLKKKL